MEKQGNIIQVLDAHKTLRFFEEYREVPIEHHWRGSPLRGRRTLAETGRGTYMPGQSRVPSLVTLTSKGQPSSVSVLCVRAGKILMLSSCCASYVFDMWWCTSLHIPHPPPYYVYLRLLVCLTLLPDVLGRGVLG